MNNKEKIIFGIIAVAIAVIVLALAGKSNNEFVKKCTSMGYSESYCLVKA